MSVSVSEAGRADQNSFKISKICISLLIAIALAFLTAFTVYKTTQLEPENKKCFLALSSFDKIDEIRSAWRSRIASNLLASKFFKVTTSHLDFIPKRMQFRFTIAAYTFIWLVAIYALFVFLTKRPLDYIFGIFGCISFAYNPYIDARFYPWDLPILLIFSLFLISLLNKYNYLIVLLPALGMAFKETSIVLCVAPLFLFDSKKEKVKYFLISLGLAVFVKVCIDILVGNSQIFFTQDLSNYGKSNFSQNLELLLQSPYLLMINSMTLLCSLIIKSPSKHDYLLKSIIVLFLLGIITCGLVSEVRIFMEVAPLSLYLIFSFWREDGQ